LSGQCVLVCLRQALAAIDHQKAETCRKRWVRPDPHSFEKERQRSVTGGCGACLKRIHPHNGGGRAGGRTGTVLTVPGRASACSRTAPPGCRDPPRPTSAEDKNGPARSSTGTAFRRWLLVSCPPRPNRINVHHTAKKVKFGSVRRGATGMQRRLLFEVCGPGTTTGTLDREGRRLRVLRFQGGADTRDLERLLSNRGRTTGPTARAQMDKGRERQGDVSRIVRFGYLTRVFRCTSREDAPRTGAARLAAGQANKHTAVNEAAEACFRSPTSTGDGKLHQGGDWKNRREVDRRRGERDGGDEVALEQ